MRNLFDLDAIFEATAANLGSGGGQQVVSVGNDVGAIRIGDVDAAVAAGIAAAVAGVDAARGRQSSAGSRPAWDENEYGVSLAEAERRLALATTAEAREAVIKDLQASALRRFGIQSIGGQVQLAYAGADAWHGLGTQYRDGMTKEDILKVITYNVVKVRNQVPYKGQLLNSASYSLVREDTATVIGDSVGSRYTVVPMSEALDYVNDVVDGRETRYESAGVLEGGATAFIAARLPSADIASEQADRFVLFTAHYGTGRMNEIVPTAERAICKNTYLTAQRRDGSRAFKIRHTSGYRNRLDVVKDHLAKVSEDFRAFKEQAERLATVKMNTKQVHGYFTAVVDDLKADSKVGGVALTAESIVSGEALKAILEGTAEADKAELTRSYERQVRARQTLWEEIMGRYESPTCDTPAVGGSAWAAVNAVTETAQHSDKVVYRGEGRTRLEARMDSITGGKALVAQEVAMTRALAMAN
jgi:phage/plasmid-like protein (TIGR03299 family)